MASPDDLTGANAPLYAARKGVYPKKVDGPFRRFKWAIMGITLAIYYGTPWIRWDRGPYAPDQAVLSIWPTGASTCSRSKSGRMNFTMSPAC